jgi:hypothetical protein
MAAGSLAERRDAHQHGNAHEKPGQSSSAERLIAATQVQVIHTRSPSTAESRSPQRGRESPPGSVPQGAGVREGEGA